MISRLSLIRPDILLERNESGQANWVFGSDQPQMRDARQTDTNADQTAGSDGADVPLIEIPIAEIVDGQVRYVIACLVRISMCAIFRLNYGCHRWINP